MIWLHHCHYNKLQKQKHPKELDQEPSDVAYTIASSTDATSEGFIAEVIIEKPQENTSETEAPAEVSENLEPDLQMED